LQEGQPDANRVQEWWVVEKRESRDRSGKELKVGVGQVTLSTNKL